MTSALIRSLIPAFLCCTIILIATSCSTREPIRIIEEYELPFISDRALRYYYFRTPENDTIHMDFTISLEDGIKYVTEETFAKDGIQSLRKFRITPPHKELVEEVVYYDSDFSPGEIERIPVEIVEYAETVDGPGYQRGDYAKIYRTSSGVVSKIKTFESFLSEETYRYDGQDIPSLKYEAHHTVMTHFKYFPFFATTVEVDGYIIYSKGVGLTYFWSKSPDRETSHTLVGTEYLD